jgi:molybdenum cofactor biosynthesis enzyme
MVDLGQKSGIERKAVTSSEVVMKPEILALEQDSALKRNDALDVACLAGIMATT